MDYLTVRHIHIACAVISIALFAVRGAFAISGTDWRRVFPLRWLPHVNDTVLLCAGVWMAYTSGQYPGRQAWLTVKLVALIFYVLLGRQTLRPGLSPNARLPWFAAALAVVFYIVAVAHARNPLPWQFNT